MPLPESYHTLSDIGRLSLVSGPQSFFDANAALDCLHFSADACSFRGWHDQFSMLFPMSESPSASSAGDDFWTAASSCSRDLVSPYILHSEVDLNFWNSPRFNDYQNSPDYGDLGTSLMQSSLEMEANPTLPTTKVAKLFPKGIGTGNFQFKERPRIEETTQEGTHKRTATHTPKSRSKAGKDEGHIRKLRTASRKSKNQRYKKNSGAGSALLQQDDPAPTPQQHRARSRHNQSEKQYRERLNQHFLHLLDALPKHVQNGCTKAIAADANQSSNPEGCQDDEERKLSKGEVLDMATQYIKMLEQVNKTLNMERDSLLRRMEKGPVDSDH
ncbi:hypothetical protein B0T10DRAFT_591512 [Thelonectria olida]|uniref:BHLH domain-containing protein n=1 Tax=Thelonectria olida TaxID=1576542 RepID=A0A9P9AIM0_9HYPO|nr:hypothetical protein B0T10DRAFT_591512 [Thelonectria olida]